MRFEPKDRNKLNAATRGRRKQFREFLEKALYSRSELPDGKPGPLLIEKLAMSILRAADGGDMQAAKLLLDRLDPAPERGITINNNIPTAEAVRGEVRTGVREALADALNVSTTHEGGNGRCS